MSEWQPIETAPHDKEILLFADGYQHTIGRCRKNVRGEQWWESDYGYTIVNPTHWMPLPNPPSQ